MIRTLKSRLAVKVFLLTALLTGGCCCITYGCLARFAPYIYSHDLSEAESLTWELAMVLSDIYLEETPYLFSEYEDILASAMDHEYILHLFNSSGEEVTATEAGLAPMDDSRIEDFSDQNKTEPYTFSPLDCTQEYTLLAAANTRKESQIVEALEKSLPALGIIILIISMAAACFYTWYLARPIRQISRISQRMAGLDFGGTCPTGRADEIGVLAQSLNQMSEKLSAALSQLQLANQKLQRDIDQERQLEQQRREFFSAASHELKTPITIIKGQLEGMLYRIGRYQDRDAYLAQSLETVGTLEHMVQELLVISRLDAPGYACSCTRISLDQLVEERLFALEDLFVQKELDIKKELEPGIFIDGDRLLLAKALDNLLSNAAAYSPAGSLVHVRLWPEAEHGMLTLENTGIHIPDADIPRLFEAFYRVDSSRNRMTGGSGLGLYIVKTILELHGATADIANTARGVEVSLCLPLHIVKQR